MSELLFLAGFLLGMPFGVLVYEVSSDYWSKKLSTLETKPTEDS